MAYDMAYTTAFLQKDPPRLAGKHQSIDPRTPDSESMADLLADMT